MIMEIKNNIYNNIGLILVNASPKNATKVIVRAELHADEDTCKYEFDYIDNNGQMDWFDPDGRAVGDLTDELIKLKHYFIDNNLTNGKPIWHGCEVIVDLEKNKIHVDFKYD